MKIPEKIKKAAVEYCFDGVRFAGTLDGAQVFCESPEPDASGHVPPTGLPRLLVLDGYNVVLARGDAALRLLSLLDEP